MNFGFIIDNRKCIGCHACTVACKSEHDVPLGVNRTWVKYIEKGKFPNTRRLFSVMRCNHCDDAPCVDICPTSALFTRADGIVDFDSRRCIACKGCMQACPYDALYIDPETDTAAKCNYCAHRVDVGLEPSCVVVCPEHAIISGDMDNPDSEIAQLLAREQTTARKVEKGTKPKLFYIEGDEISLNPTLAEPTDSYLWSSQSGGVGHFSQYVESRIAEKAANGSDENGQSTSELSGQSGRRVYDAPQKGTLWGWEVAAYIWTKAISAGAFLVPFTAGLLGIGSSLSSVVQFSLITALLFLLLTTMLLVKDLDQPKRFLYVLLRPQWRSWLVRGGYALVIYGGLLSLKWLPAASKLPFLDGLTAIFAIITAVYTAFLFAQAKGRDFWQSPILSFHMLVHAFMAGAAIFGIADIFLGPNSFSLFWDLYLGNLLKLSIFANLIILAAELVTPHATHDSKLTVQAIVRGRYRKLFWAGTIGIGNILPVIILMTGSELALPGAGLLTLLGIYCTEYIWVKAPQDIPLS